MTQISESDSPLIRSLGGWDTTALVVGSVIGSGVFAKAAAMANEVSSPVQLVAAWAVAGLLSLIGALTYAELGAMMPHAGGEYIYLRKAYGEKSYGDAAAFFYGWGRFAVASTASIAALAVITAQFLRALIDFGDPWWVYEIKIFHLPHTLRFGWEQVLAVGVILVISLLNCFSVAIGGRLQTVLTVIKILSLLLIIFGVLFFSKTATLSHLATPSGAPAWSGFSAFGAAMLAALWGYDGWNNMPMAAGEVRDPGKNVPRALIGGMIVIMALYCFINFAYVYALPYSEIAATQADGSLSVAQLTTKTFLGDSGAKIISIALVISTIGALNGAILTSARIPFAMARDGLFFRAQGTVHAVSRVPVIAVLTQAVWACVLALSGTFDQLTDCLLFVSWNFYALVAAGVIILRYTHPDASRPYKVWGYPYTPIAFILFAAALNVNTLVNKQLESLVGIVLLALGIPIYLYFYWRRRNKKSAEA